MAEELTWVDGPKPYRPNPQAPIGESTWYELDSEPGIHAAVYGKRSDGRYVFKKVHLSRGAPEAEKEKALADAMKELEVRGLAPDAVTVDEGDQIKDGW